MVLVSIGFRVKSLGLYVSYWAIQGFYGVAQAYIGLCGVI